MQASTGFCRVRFPKWLLTPSSSPSPSVKVLIEFCLFQELLNGLLHNSCLYILCHTIWHLTKHSPVLSDPAFPGVVLYPSLDCKAPIFSLVVFRTLFLSHYT